MSLIHDRAVNQFRLPLGDGKEAVIDYSERDPGTLALTHTFVPPERRGRGHGGKIVEAVLRHAREEGLRVVPTCPFVAAYVREHPEHADLVA